jgi:hypothetical protein
MNAMKNDNEAQMLDMGFSEGKPVKRRRERMAVKNRKQKVVNKHAERDAERNFKKTKVSKAISGARKLHDKWRNPIIEDEYNERKPSNKVTWKSLGVKPESTTTTGDVWPRRLSMNLRSFRKGIESVESDPEPCETNTEIHADEIKPRWRQHAEYVLNMMRSKLGF